MLPKIGLAVLVLHFRTSLADSLSCFCYIGPAQILFLLQLVDLACLAEMQKQVRVRFWATLLAITKQNSPLNLFYLTCVILSSADLRLVREQHLPSAEQLVSYNVGGS